MRRDDRDDPFDDIFDQIERMMNEMAGGMDDAGFGTETHVDIHEDDDELRLVADLPGVSKDDINLRCDGETLTVDARGDRREYSERVRLPARVDEHSAAATFNNGILEVTLDRVDDASSADIDVR
ncbi:MAG: Hsp20/alpha crystallin family protein [Halolamina sp.]